MLGSLRLFQSFSELAYSKVLKIENVPSIGYSLTPTPLAQLGSTVKEYALFTCRIDFSDKKLKIICRSHGCRAEFKFKLLED